MESPNIENGHIDIANEIVDRLCSFHLSGNEWLVIWVVLRKTWGWHKKDDPISLTQFEKLTKLSRPSVKEALNKLVGKKVLVVGKKVLGINVWGFNKHYSQWVVGNKVLVGFSVRLVGKKVLPLVGKKEHTKETTTKETITKENIYITTNVVSKKDINYFLGLFKEVNPSYTRFYSNKSERQAIDRLQKQYGDERLEKMINSLAKINTIKYSPVILSPYQLEIKMGQLLAFYKKEKTNADKRIWFINPA